MGAHKRNQKQDSWAARAYSTFKKLCLELAQVDLRKAIDALTDYADVLREAKLMVVREEKKAIALLQKDLKATIKLLKVKYDNGYRPVHFFDYRAPLPLPAGHMNF